MKKSKKIVFIIILLVLALAVSLIRILAPRGMEKRFNTIIKEYDKMHTERVKKYENEDVLRCYDLCGNMGFVAVGKGYDDDILIFAEFSSEKVENVQILYHNETIGHGDLVVEDWFLQRLVLPYDEAFKTVRGKKESANEIIAITGATITSDAVVSVINECVHIMEEVESEKEH